MKEVRGFISASRYLFDGTFLPSMGWSQIDTDQDAWYFGQWANPLTLSYSSYVEGDTYDARSEDEQEFVEFMKSIRSWSIESGHGFKIDPMGNEAVKQRWIDLGFKEDLH